MKVCLNIWIVAAALVLLPTLAAQAGSPIATASPSTIASPQTIASGSGGMSPVAILAVESRARVLGNRGRCNFRYAKKTADPDLPKALCRKKGG